jgi:hypothetical protein
MDKIIDAIMLGLFVGFIFIITKGFVTQAAERKKQRDSKKNASSK